RLVDGAFAAVFSLHRLHRHAVGLHAAIAAAFADGFIDEYAFGRIGIIAAFPAAAFFGGAGLIVNDDGGAGRFARFLLGGVHPPAVQHGHFARNMVAVFIEFGIFGHDPAFGHALGDTLLRHAVYR